MRALFHGRACGEDIVDKKNLPLRRFYQMKRTPQVVMSIPCRKRRLRRCRASLRQQLNKREVESSGDMARNDACLIESAFTHRSSGHRHVRNCVDPVERFLVFYEIRHAICDEASHCRLSFEFERTYESAPIALIRTERTCAIESAHPRAAGTA